MGLHRIAVVFAFAFGFASLAHAEPPPDRPVIPALIVGADAPRSFIVRGIIRGGQDGGGVAFYVAVDGEREVCAVYDPADGTPILLSDGRQTLIYDLENAQLLRVQNFRSYFRIDFEPDARKPLMFRFGAEIRTAPEHDAKSASYFRLDRFAASRETFAIHHDDDGKLVFSNASADGGTQTIRVRPDDLTTFTFASVPPNAALPNIEVHATHIGVPLPPEALTFPDPHRFPKETGITQIDEVKLRTLLPLIRSGKSMLAKIAIADPSFRKMAHGTMPHANWTELRERDARFGAIYRQALADQGLILPTLPHPTTQPAE